ncbi:MAG: D-alanine--D-alanine ligase [Flavobacteriales bacterium]|nr:D-alanine--D-alanine ligase [Flavobacteriales bacterium]|tara:strand:- start:157 stop:1131 length:975 start_codon:yes stop_codon:yes gene_type:complete
MEKKLRIAIAAGGDSAEEIISMKTGKMVYDHLDRSRYEVVMVKMRHGDWNAIIDEEECPINKNDFSFEYQSKKYNFDYVFIAIHGTPGEDGKLQAYFDLLKLPYSSPDHIGSTLTFNKWYCNTLLSQMGYNVANSHYMRRGDKLNEAEVVEKIGLPCFVKPCSCGSSFGISKVKEQSALFAAVSEAFEYDHEIMIESFMPGKEVTCGVYQKGDQIVALPITQIIPKGEFFDYAAKYEGDSQEITPARISATLSTDVQKVASEIYHKLNLRGVVRVDFMLVESTPYVIEVNAVPGLSPESLVPQQVRAANIPMNQFFTDIIEATR